MAVSVPISFAPWRSWRTWRFKKAIFNPSAPEYSHRHFKRIGYNLPFLSLTAWQAGRSRRLLALDPRPPTLDSPPL